MNQEIEIKLAVSSGPEAVRERLERAGARLSDPRSFEDNILYDDPSLSLSGSGRILRLRTIGDSGTSAGAKVTLKGPPQQDEGIYKIRTEIEMEVSDPAACDGILKELGFRPVYRYQKYRTLFRARGLVIAFDETPIGNYLELEGEPEAIDDFAGTLGYSREDYINLSYRALQQSAAGSADPGDMLLEESPT